MRRWWLSGFGQRNHDGLLPGFREGAAGEGRVDQISQNWDESIGKFFQDGRADPIWSQGLGVLHGFEDVDDFDAAVGLVRGHVWKAFRSSDIDPISGVSGGVCDEEGCS